ncbi:MAG: rRNA maturation factor [Bacteroidetes bacterium]|jgi:rRNA maturation RNase YbeY|nr:rRNA maturation factor [Bacteroidota bacterium]MDF2453039.1 rRNA maturation factor [Bacteroidota bacterium]
MISFQNLSIDFKLKEKTKLKQWIKAVTEKEKHTLGTINYIFCSDEELLEINIRHLNHNTYTDIITFDYTESKKISSDIFISVDRVAENAKKFNVTFEEELHRVMIHGVLHLCGYKDKSKADADLMRQKENQALKSFK